MATTYFKATLAFCEIVVPAQCIRGMLFDATTGEKINGKTNGVVEITSEEFCNMLDSMGIE